MTDDQFVTALNAKLDGLSKDILAREDRVRELSREIGNLQDQAAHIVKLLEAEGVTPASSLVSGVKRPEVAQSAYELLRARQDHRPEHYKELARAIAAEGMVIPGKEPSANLLASISRDKRFVRVGRGTYGLTEWPTAVEAKRRRTKKRKTRSRRRVSKTPLDGTRS